MKRIAIQFLVGIVGAAFSFSSAGAVERGGRNAAPGDSPASSLPTVELREASPMEFPGETDCNSPAHWDGETFYLFNSAGAPVRSSGPDLFHLGTPSPAEYDNEVNGGRWIECTWKADDGTLYGWYHNEPHGLCPGTTLTAPRIGAVRSRDNGAHFEDLGIVLEARPNTLRCDAKNGYFAGGNGDFSIMLDKNEEFIYFFFGNYAGDLLEQGVCAARMRYVDRNSPVGKAAKWHAGNWNEPGLGGRLTPIFPAAVEWAREDADAFWGPSIHWNTHLKLYVILLGMAAGGNLCDLQRRSWRPGRMDVAKKDSRQGQLVSAGDRHRSGEAPDGQARRPHRPLLYGRRVALGNLLS
jgi:hypothetical protein